MSARDLTWQDYLQCKFCEKRAHEVNNMIAGPDHICICNECVMLCLDIINDTTPGAREYDSWHVPTGDAAPNVGTKESK